MLLAVTSWQLIITYYYYLFFYSQMANYNKKNMYLTETQFNIFSFPNYKTPVVTFRLIRVSNTKIIWGRSGVTTGSSGNRYWTEISSLHDQHLA